MSIFFVVSGGPYAMETLVSSSGAGAALVLILAVPFLWSLPAALMTAELTSAMPEEGGYYVWVREALGPFAGFLCGWWSWVYSWVDISLYPGLFAAYVLSFARQIPAFHQLSTTNPGAQWLIGFSIVLPIVWLNIRGIKISGNVNLVFGILLLAPFVVMVALAIPRFGQHPFNLFKPFTPIGSVSGDQIGSSLFVIMWNYLAWDSLSTVAGETENPKGAFPKALFYSFPIIVATYFLTFAAGIAVVPTASQWTEGSWPTIATEIGGRWLGLAIAAGAIVSVLGMMNATLLSASRLPFVLAEDRFLPNAVTKLHRHYQTPWVGILISAAVATVLTLRSFDTLVKVDVIVYSASLVLEFAALVALRYKKPDLARSYKIPGGKIAVWAVALVPTLLVIAASRTILAGSASMQIVLIALLSGPLVFALAKYWPVYKPARKVSTEV